MTAQTPSRLERKLRAGDPPVVGRIEDERLMFDLRTVLPEEEELLAQRLRRRAWTTLGPFLVRAFRVLTRIFSPSVMNGGTCTTSPVSIFAGLVTLETVAPLHAGLGLHHRSCPRWPAVPR